MARTPCLDASAVADLKLLRQLCVRLVRSEVGVRPSISSWTALLAYGRVAQEMAAQQAVLDQLQGGGDG